MGIALITNNIVSDSNIAIAALSPSYAAGGVTSTGVSTLVFSNANGVSFGMNGSTVTASAAGGGAAGAIQSYYENMMFPAANTTTIGIGQGASVSSNYIQPFNLPYDVSASYIRMPYQVSFATTSAATGNSTLSYAQSQSHTIFVNIYTMGTGVNSNSLQLLTQATAGMSLAYSVSYAASNAQTIFHSVSYPVTGGSSSVTYSFASATAQIYMGSGGLTAMTGAKQIDIPFAASLPQGAYWMALQRSSASSASTQVSATVSANIYNLTNMAVAQVNSYNQLGINGNTTDGIQIGMGIYQASAAGATSASIALSQISMVATQPRFPFQLIRRA